MKSLKKSLLVIMVLVCLAFVGCNNATESNPQSTKNGWFVDAPLAGLAYKTSSGITGVTNDKGMYEYYPGDTVTFLLGDAQLGNSVEAAAVVTPCSLTGTDSISNNSSEAEEALNMVKLFLALDTDGSDFGISLDKKLSTENLTTESLSALLESSDFDADIKTFFGEETVVPSKEEATKHYNQVAGQIDGEEDLSHHEKLLPVVQKRFEVYPENTLLFACYFPEGINVIIQNYKEQNDSKKNFTSQDSYVNGNKEYVIGWNPYKTNVEDCDWCSMYNPSGCACLQEGNYSLSLVALQDESKISVGDLLCYYDGFSFQKEKLDTFPLTVNNDKKQIVYVDFTSSKHNTKIENVYKITGEISIDCNTEEYEKNSGKVLKDNPFTFFVFDDKSNMIPLTVDCKRKSTEETRTIYTYETSVLPETTSIQVTYNPFTDWSFQKSDENSSLNLVGNTELDFEIITDLPTN